MCISPVRSSIKARKTSLFWHGQGGVYACMGVYPKKSMNSRSLKFPEDLYILYIIYYILYIIIYLLLYYFISFLKEIIINKFQSIHTIHRIHRSKSCKQSPKKIQKKRGFEHDDTPTKKSPKKSMHTAYIRYAHRHDLGTLNSRNGQRPFIDCLY